MLTLHIVLAIHTDQIATYGGLDGVRDMGGLESALAQVNLEVFGEQLHPTPELRAAALLYRVTRNHPFADGNKRTAWAALAVGLLLEGFELEMGDDEAYVLVNRVAAGELDKAQIADELRPRLRASGI